MQKNTSEETRDGSFGPIRVSRRELAKLAGVTGVSVLSVEPVSADGSETSEVSILMNIQPTFDRVLIQQVESEEKTDSGIIIPNSAQDVPGEGIVRATGDDAEVVTEGDKVLFSEEDAIEVVIEGEEHLILDEETVLAIINE